MRIVLKGPEADHYFRLLAQDERLAALQSSVDELIQAVTHLTTRQEELVSESSAQLNARLDDLAADIVAARDKVVSTVQAESAEDQEQNARLAAKQADLDAANLEIQQLRDQLAAGVSPAEAAVIGDRIATLRQQVADLSAASQVTDPNAPA